MNQRWPFDQDPDVAAITTRQVIELGFPILMVVHYADGDWAFTCGTTSDEKDGRVIAMKTAVKFDPRILEVGDLQLGWKAWRQSPDSDWVRSESPDA